MVKITRNGQEISIDDVEIPDEILKLIAECCD